MRRRPTSLRSVAERQHRLAIWPVLSTGVFDWLVQLPPNERRKENSVQQMHAGNASRGRVVRKLFVAGVGVSRAVRSARDSGDLPISEPIYAPAYRAPPIIALNWTGCYLGGHIGGSFIDKKFNCRFVDAAVPSTFGAPTSFAISDSSTDLGSTGILAGGQVGCNLQFATNWVVGIEADAPWANSQGGGGSGQQTRSATLIGDLPGITTAVNSNGFASSKNDFIARLQRAGSATPSVVWAKVWSAPSKGGAAWGARQVSIQRPGLDHRLRFGEYCYVPPAVRVCESDDRHPLCLQRLRDTRRLDCRRGYRVGSLGKLVGQARI